MGVKKVANGRHTKSTEALCVTYLLAAELTLAVNNVGKYSEGPSRLLARSDGGIKAIVYIYCPRRT